MSGGTASVRRAGCHVVFVPPALPRTLLAFPVVALVSGDANQPALQGFRIAQPGELVEQIQTDPLENVGRILVRGAVAERNGIDEVLVAVYQDVPGLLVSSQTLLDQARVGPVAPRGRAH